MAYGQYVGSYNALDPGISKSYGELFTGYSIGKSGSLGSSTSFQTANQIAEVNQRLNEGMRMIEVSPMSAHTFESIPTQHLEEIRRLAKMSGADISLHTAYGGDDAIDPSGFQGKAWDESARNEAERRMFSIVEKGQMMSPKGNPVVTFHPTTQTMGTQYTVEGKKAPQMEQLGVVDTSTGEVKVIPKEYRFDEGKGKMRWYSPEEMLDIKNHSDWNNTLFNISNQKNESDKVMMEATPFYLKAQDKIKSLRDKDATEEEIKKSLNQEEWYGINKVKGFVEPALVAVHSMISDTIERAYKSYDEQVKIANPEDKEKIREAQRELGRTAKAWSTNLKNANSLQDRSKAYDLTIYELSNIGIKEKIGEHIVKEDPKKFVTTEDFAVSRAAETFGNVAWKAYDKFKDKAPVIAIENFMPNAIFSRADKLKELVKASREQFVDNAVKKGMSEDRAEKAAEKVIGATWDVGHINLLRKEGYEGKELKKKIIEETEKIAPFTKHMHLTDNFGFADTHLSPGMGNVPIKAIMEEMEKAGFSGKSIVEAGNFAANFKAPPHPYALEALGAQSYSGGSAWQMGMYGAGGSYFGGVGNFPEQHFAMYGAGFSGLPSSLGGQAAGGKSRFSGAPME
jgi:sugar phosphate isomerase/epimerase